MCYHTTFLFSLCGHISVSPNPVRNAPACEVANPAQNQQSKLSTANLAQAGRSRPGIGGSAQTPIISRVATGRISDHGITSPFPSPQEFESVQQVHDLSRPASPTSPSIIRKLQGPDSRPSSGYGDDNLTPCGDKSSVLPETEEGTAELKGASVCPIVAHHPLHTYILPALCPSCRFSRERNIAKFELQIIKESIDREQWGHHRGNTAQVVFDAQRKRIHSRSAGKGKLIPLICVEENRIVKEAMNEQASDTQSQRQSLLDESEIAENVGEYSRMVRGLMQLDRDEQSVSGTFIGGKQTRNSATQSIPTKIAGDALASWGRSWWARSASSSQNSAATSQFPTPLSSATTRPLSRDNEDEQHLFTPRDLDKEHGSNVGWSQTQETWKRISSEMKRDMHGRNASAMSKIMAFNAGTTRSGK